MLLANYASDSDSDAGSDVEPSVKPSKTTTTVPPTRTAIPSSSTSAAKPALPKAKKPVKITLGLPKAGTDDAEDVVKNGGDDKDEVDEDGERESKKPKIAGGKGGSSLLGMLPPPKRKLPTSTTSTSKASSLKVNKSMATPSSSASASTSKINIPKPVLSSTRAIVADDDDEDDEKDKLLPPSLARKAQKKKEEEQLDLFGLSTTPAAAHPSSSSSSSTLKPTLISSAPLAPDYIPPAPTPNDPYPGYYQLPSGEWRAYDPAYYASFFVPPSAEEEETEDGRVGKHWNEFKDGQFKDDILEVNAINGVEEARREEERAGLMKKRKINENEFEYKPIGQVKGLASQRHQLTSLLNTAYTQREELEDRIAQNKKNMRMAGTKYAYLHPSPSSCVRSILSISAPVMVYLANSV
uniref:Uncharacterized protein n=1 Tax=Kwoniella bestiolae CBS 10118 TaxID=1296100 RepID=A0A1B9G852_9TREE|nr:hypothetical protein I302_02009 [Kwoniella bestiolae CBS 10118]OCF27171.1 hypothetical protein I302_02009 [Kwoniella bestiolae CBS 10118]